MTASRYGMLSGMTSIQIAIRIPADLLEAIDGLISGGMAENRAALVRQALERFVDEAERIRIDQAIIEGYRRLPATREEEAAALAAIRQSIAEETW
jgi:metal-responsive CopG/Arc/MetJ family transcriptional regulator